MAAQPDEGGARGNALAAHHNLALGSAAAAVRYALAQHDHLCLRNMMASLATAILRSVSGGASSKIRSSSARDGAYILMPSSNTSRPPQPQQIDTSPGLGATAVPSTSV